MELNWMGRYRALIETVVRHRNAFARVQNNKTEEYGDISISIVEWEMLEYIIEHENDDASMIQLSTKLAIPPSTLSKCSGVLCGYGLVAKYQVQGNRKNVILKPTDKGLDYYRERAQILSDTIFGRFFEVLDPLSDDDLDRFARALECLTPQTDGASAVTDEEKYRRID